MTRARKSVRRTAVALLAAAVCATSAQAQVSPLAITVEVSLQTRAPTARPGVKAPVDQVTLTHQVGYEDLDLAVKADRLELRRRVAETAHFACEQLERLYPRHAESIARCASQAIEDAASQIEAAIDAAERDAEGQ